MLADVLQRLFQRQAFDIAGRTHLAREAIMLILHERQEQSFLVPKLGVKGSEGPASQAHDVIHAGRLVAVLKEYLTGGLQEGLPTRHTSIGLTGFRIEGFDRGSSQVKYLSRSREDKPAAPLRKRRHLSQTA